MTRNFNTKQIDYRKQAYVWTRHHERYKAYVEKEGLPCQDCCGYGGGYEPVLDDGSGPWYPCEWCEGTGKVTRWVRGLWLAYRREAKRRRLREKR